jgi:DNA-directed RNA polymerase subunit F
MKVKAIRSEEKVTLSEVKGVLTQVETERLGSGKEMSYELRKSIEHANQLAKMSPEDRDCHGS